MRSLMFMVVVAVTLTRTAVATADETDDRGIEPTSEREGRPAAANPGAGQCPTPVYTADWNHLAELTRSDEAVFRQAEAGLSRRKMSGEIGLVGGILGGGTAAVSTLVRLGADHWSYETKMGLGAGLGVGLVSLLIAWAIAPDDFLTVINTWNLHHPDRPLSP